MSVVHNHGPAEGRGLDCAESVQEDGSLIGACLAAAAVAIVAVTADPFISSVQPSSSQAGLSSFRYRLLDRQ